MRGTRGLGLRVAPAVGSACLLVLVLKLGIGMLGLVATSCFRNSAHTTLFWGLQFVMTSHHVFCARRWAQLVGFC